MSPLYAPVGRLAPFWLSIFCLVSHSSYHHNVLTRPRQLSAKRPHHAFLLFIVHANLSTVTLQRINGPVTGPKFIDVEAQRTPPCMQQLRRENGGGASSSCPTLPLEFLSSHALITKLHSVFTDGLMEDDSRLNVFPITVAVVHCVSKSEE
ncbi:hypothetical protein BC827DRAFT_1273480 [Russula dissimulans]|nr:hypothetical protein BC827DRAFT_1273480 [Russula dissimulans]